MEKPISVTTFLHDIGLFVEKYLSASSIKVCASLQAELAQISRLGSAFCMRGRPISSISRILFEYTAIAPELCIHKL